MSTRFADQPPTVGFPGLEQTATDAPSGNRVKAVEMNSEFVTPEGPVSLVGFLIRIFLGSIGEEFFCFASAKSEADTPVVIFSLNIKFSPGPWPVNFSGQGAQKVPQPLTGPDLFRSTLPLGFDAFA